MTEIWQARSGEAHGRLRGLLNYALHRSRRS
jgi:hypothetical protein